MQLIWLDFRCWTGRQAAVDDKRTYRQTHIRPVVDTFWRCSCREQCHRTEPVVVASDLSEVFSIECDSEVVEDRRMPIPFESSVGC